MPAASARGRGSKNRAELLGQGDRFEDRPRSAPVCSRLWDHGRLLTMEKQRLPGGNAGGAGLAGGTVRRPTGPWTPAVHALLRQLQARGLAGAPTVLGLDEHGTEVLTYLPGQTVGTPRRSLLSTAPRLDPPARRGQCAAPVDGY